MALQSLAFVDDRWLPRHVPSEFCWCRPKVVEHEGGWLHVHRVLGLTTSHADVASATSLEGPPV